MIENSYMDQLVSAAEEGLFDDPEQYPVPHPCYWWIGNRCHLGWYCTSWAARYPKGICLKSLELTSQEGEGRDHI
jgi:hypothetical protein